MASGVYSSIIGGTGNFATGDYSLSWGSGARAVHTGTGSYDFSIALGRGDSAVGNRSVAIGANNVARGTNSIVFGYTNLAIGSNTFIGGGLYHTVLGAQSVVVGGNGNDVNGSNSIVYGTGNTINGNQSAILSGTSNTASGHFSVVLSGGSNFASGQNSLVSGTSLHSSSINEVVFGRYNDSSASTAGHATVWSASDPLFTLGNGTNVSTRTNAFQVLKNGDAYAASWNIISDREYKESFTSIVTPLERIMKIKSYNYYFNETYKDIYGDKMQTGFIAQELQETFPELVSQTQGKLAVNYVGLIPVITESIKIQQQIIEDQNKKIEELEIKIKEINDIKSENKQLKERIDKLEKALNKLIEN